MNQMVDYLDRMAQINLNNHAFRKSHRTSTTIMQIADMLYQATDENKVTVLMTLDETATFDSVDHRLLLDKMVVYNFHPNGSLTILVIGLSMLQ